MFSVKQDEPYPTVIDSYSISNCIDDDGSFNGNKLLRDYFGIPDSIKVNQLPEQIIKEIGIIQEVPKVRLNEDGDVLSYVTLGDPKQVFNRISDEFFLKGWTKIDSNSDVIGTFIKEEGKYHWCYVSCAEYEKQSIVVMHIIDK